jgi:hypothetical protein
MGSMGSIRGMGLMPWMGLMGREEAMPRMRLMGSMHGLGAYKEKSPSGAPLLKETTSYIGGKSTAERGKLTPLLKYVGRQ